MSRDPVMSRLRDANPDLVVDMPNEQLRDLIVSKTPTWRSGEGAGRPVPPRAWVPKISPVGRLRSGIAASGMVAAALAVTLIVSLSGSAPNVAQAFPALNGPSVLTPGMLQQSLAAYGVGPHDGGLRVGTGHAVSTPWGTGYVLTSPSDSFVCVVAPGLSRAEWGASCARTQQAISSGTLLTAYAYDSTTNTGRLLALLPQGATATMQTGGSAARQLSLSDGVLAVDITSPTEIAVTSDGHTTSDHVSPQDATAAPTSGTSGTSATSTSGTSATSTTAAGTTTAAAP
jgi:hypothetical protein